MYKPIFAFIATRHLRSRRQTRFASFVSVVSILGIGLGVAVLIIVSSVMNGFENEVSKHVLGMTSHASILYPGQSMTEWSQAKRTLSADPDIIASAEFVRGGAMINHRGQVHGIIIQGVNFSAEEKVSDIGSYVKAEQKNALNSGKNIILGRELMRKLRVESGQRVSIVAPRIAADFGMQAPKYFTYQVIGDLSVGMHEFDSSLALVSVANAQEIFNLADAVSGLRVKFQDPATAPEKAMQAAGLLSPPAASINWTQYHRNFFQALKSQKRIMFVILSIIVAVAAFNIIAAMIMLVKEKHRDIAILRTLGMSRSSIMSLFIFQGTVVGICGVACGVALGLLGAHYAGEVVVWLEKRLGLEFIKPDVYYIDYLPTLVRSHDVILVAGVAAFITVIATIYPAWRASLTNPAEALRYE